ncbi:MAG: hypothetical protein K0M70_10235, partial [Arenimonas sp.]|uniref:hypothetical protein n=1 Tax=Arenimonas sp. TaxID=1872635 RepID=UPI0025BB1445
GAERRIGDHQFAHLRVVGQAGVDFMQGRAQRGVGPAGAARAGPTPRCARPCMKSTPACPTTRR